MRRVEKQKENYDRRHGARELEELAVGEEVWIADKKFQGTVVRRTEHPRSYIVQAPSGQVRRNRYHLRRLEPVPQDEEGSVIEGEETTSLVTNSGGKSSSKTSEKDLAAPEPNKDAIQSTPKIYTRSGRQSKPPRRLNL